MEEVDQSCYKYKKRSNNNNSEVFLVLFGTSIKGCLHLLFFTISRNMAIETRALLKHEFANTH